MKVKTIPVFLVQGLPQCPGLYGYLLSEKKQINEQMNRYQEL